MTAKEFSRKGLGRIHRVMSGYVQRGSHPGLVAAVARGDEAHFEVLGRRDADRGEAMSRDSIFRIASMSKPVTAVAALMLVEDCVLRLDDPVDELLPELADRRVLEAPDGPLEATVPAERPITLRDLLTFRSGYGATWDPDWPITRALRERGVAVAMPRSEPAWPPTDGFLRALGEVPLLHQPGHGWSYHTGSALTGALIERASGLTLPEFLRRHVFEPLGMDDTGFVVPPEKQDRLVTAYRDNPDTGSLSVLDPAEGGAWSERPPFPDGGGDLVSTVEDYLVFARMLMNGGVYSGTRLLSRPTVELMTTDQLTEQNKREGALYPGMWDSDGWGFGLRVATGRTRLARPGRYGWSGGLGTDWFNDPQRGLIAILLTQRAFDSPKPPPVCLDFETCAYAALEG